MVCPVIMYGCESWAIKKAECQRINAFELRCWRRLLRVLWTARRSNQSIRKKINPDYSLECLMQKLKLQYFGHLMQRADSLKKTLMLGKTEGKRRGQQRMRWLGGMTDSMNMNLGKLQKRYLSPRNRQELDMTWQQNHNKLVTSTHGFCELNSQASYMVLLLTQKILLPILTWVCVC